MKRKNILIGKVGKSVKLSKVKLETGGDAVPLFYSTLSRMLPEYHFYIIGPNELNRISEEERTKLFPYNNVHSVYECDNNRPDCFAPTVDNINKLGIKIDYALLFNGMCSLINIPNFLTKKDGSPVKILNSYKTYCGPYIYVLNKIGCPLYVMSEDARYITINAKDLYNRERLVLTQINTTLNTPPHIIDEKSLTEVEDAIDCVYSGIEKIFLMGVPNDWSNYIDVERKLKSDVSSHCIILSNGCGTKAINKSGNNSSRLSEYRKYVIDNLKGTEYEGTTIYGVWDKDIYDKVPEIKGKLMKELDDEIANAKYTLIYSQIPGFVTVKPLEVITKGLIPFIHPDYDKYRLLDLPEYLYLKDEKDFLNKMRELDADDSKYLALLEECKSLIRPEYIDGSYVVNNVMRLIEENMGGTWNDVSAVDKVLNRYEF